MRIQRCLLAIEPSGVSDPSCTDSSLGRDTEPGIKACLRPSPALRWCGGHECTGLKINIRQAAKCGSKLIMAGSVVRLPANLTEAESNCSVQHNVPDNVLKRRCILGKTYSGWMSGFKTYYFYLPHWMSFIKRCVYGLCKMYLYIYNTWLVTLKPKHVNFKWILMFQFINLKMCSYVIVIDKHFNIWRVHIQSCINDAVSLRDRQTLNSNNVAVSSHAEEVHLLLR